MVWRCVCLCRQYFNPLAPGGARPTVVTVFCAFEISIHSPRVGRGLTARVYAHVDDISIHSPRVGRGIAQIFEIASVIKFQSTRPGGGEARWSARSRACGRYFNPLAPGGARRAAEENSDLKYLISIHSPRVGRGRTTRATPPCARAFQSTRPGWGEAYNARVKWKRDTFQSTRPGWGEAWGRRLPACGH